MANYFFRRQNRHPQIFSLKKLRDLAASREKIDREIRERPPAFAESFKLIWEQFRIRAKV